MKIVHRNFANVSFDWLISGHQGVHPLKEEIFIVSVKYTIFTFVCHVKYRIFSPSTRPGLCSGPTSYRTLTVSPRPQLEQAMADYTATIFLLNAFLLIRDILPFPPQLKHLFLYHACPHFFKTFAPPFLSDRPRKDYILILDKPKLRV